MRTAKLFFSNKFLDDVPIAMHTNDKYGLVYIITKFGQLFVVDMETATAIYKTHLSPDPILLTAPAPSIGGFYSITRCRLLNCCCNSLCC